MKTLLDITLPVTNTYMVEIGVTDTIGKTSSLYFDIPTDDVPLHLGAGGKTVGIGRYADTSKENHVDIGWETSFDENVNMENDLNVAGTAHLGEVYISGVKVDYIIEQGTQGEWTYRKWHSGILEQWGRFEMNVGSWKSWGSVYESEHYIASQTYAIVSDMYDLAKMILSKIGVDTYGNSPQTLFMQWSEYLVKSVEIFYDKITGENTGYTVWAGVKKLLQAVSGLTGFPIATITRTLSGLWNHFVGANVDSLKIKYYNPSSEVKEYLGYIESGDIQKANEFYNKWLDDKEAEIVADRKADGKKELTEKEVEKKAKSSVKSSVSAKYREAYIEAYKKKDDEAMAQIRKEMYATGLYGSVDAVIETCRNWLKEYK